MLDEARRLELVDRGEETLAGLDPQSHPFFRRCSWSRRCISVEPETETQTDKDEEYNRIGNDLGVVHDFELLSLLSYPEK